MLTPADEMKQREDFSWICARAWPSANGACRLRTPELGQSGSLTNCLSQNARLVCQDPHDERSRRDHQHEGGRSNAFEIADTQMRHDRTHKVDDEANAARDP
jgi:hypothetical protein